MTTDDRFTTPPGWSSAFLDIKSSSAYETESIPDLTLSAFIESSAKFPVKFPLESVRCSQLIKTKIPHHVLERNINSTYPVIHEHALHLYTVFLSYQKRFGNKFYKNMSLVQFVDRLLKKRAVSFVGSSDDYLLLDGCSGTNGWENVGTENETEPLILKNCLSYDEIKLSNLLSISSYTCFVNNENGDEFEAEGVIIGLTGARLDKEKAMDYREILKTPEQNNHLHGYGQFFIPTLQGTFLNFYGDPSIPYDNLLHKLQEDDRFVDLGDGKYFDQLIYKRRITLTIDTFLIEANHRAKEVNKMAYVNVIDFELDSWKIYLGQDKIFMETFVERLEFLTKNLTNISDICFGHKMAGRYKDGDEINGKQLHFLDRQSYTKLLEDAEKLLVVGYPNNGNALPGNEFWTGNLTASGNSVAAFSSQVAELHNCHINPKVSALNLRVATLNGLVVNFNEYCQIHNKQ